MNPENEIFVESRRWLSRQMRADRSGADRGFMAGIVAEEFAARLATINRRFEQVLDLGSVWPSFPPLLEEALAGAAVTRIRTGESMNVVCEGQFDLVLSAFGLHWVRDLSASLSAIRSALKQDGLLLAVIPGRGTLEELRLSLLAAETNATGGAEMRVDRFPDVTQVGAMLQRAGYAFPVVDVERLQLKYDSVARLIADMRSQGTCSARQSTRPLPRSIFGYLEEAYRETCGDSDSRLSATVNLVYLAGWSPTESMRNPPAPGTDGPGEIR
jgi:SAM-dependent methyltransferase